MVHMKIIITGKPGCGKSTLIEGLIGEFRHRRVAGLATPEIREHGRRTGFEIRDLASGAREVMASERFREGPRVSKYCVSVPNIDKILDRFMESLPKAELVFIDEIGKMEFYSNRFKEVLDEVFASGKTVVATVGLPFVKQFRDRAEVYRLEGRADTILEEIKNKVEQSLGE